MGELTDDHRLLLQFFMSHRIITEENVQRHFPKRRFDTLVRDLNNSLQFMHLEVKSIVDEEDGVIYWGLVNLKNDEISQISTEYQKSEIDLFKAIVCFFIVFFFKYFYSLTFFLSFEG